MLLIHLGREKMTVSKNISILFSHVMYLFKHDGRLIVALMMASTVGVEPIRA